MNAPALATHGVPDQLQDGIYFRSGSRPGASYCLLLLNIRQGTPPAAAREALAKVWAMLQDLRCGVVRDLQPSRPSDPDRSRLVVPQGDLTCLLGIGARLFDAQFHNPSVVTLPAKDLPKDAMNRPELIMLRSDGDGTPFLSLPWVSEGERKSGEADLALQFIADTELAVNRAVVEVWKVCSDEELPLDVVTSFHGFNRDDRRSWIDFFDGINNIEPHQRRVAIEVTQDDPSWLKGGTYMAFLRLALDLASWRRLSREHQEILVGRDKLTGYPLEKVHQEPNKGLVPTASAGCPFAGKPLRSPAYTDPPRPENPLLQASHIYRANPYRHAQDGNAANRIFRQGYEFLEPLEEGRLRVGLNFVSFQRSLLIFKQILSFWGWMGDVNFGGPRDPNPGEPSPLPLAAVIAGGYYAVPPKDDPFPGASIFAAHR